VNYELIIIRYGEIALKGRETRNRFENILVSNIKKTFDLEKLSNKIKRERGRIYIHTTQINGCIDVLRKVFGITSVSPAYQTSSGMESISKLALNVSKEELNEKKSFAIRTTRTGEHNFSSQDVAIKIGNDIVKATKASVNLTKPDFELFIEIRNDKAFVFTEKIPSMGGMPINTQGKILALINSPESILAAWYLIRRGCNAIFITTEESKNMLERFIEKWYIKSKILTIPTKDKTNSLIKEIAKKNNCEAIVTGHTLNKNSIYDITKLKQQINLPVLAPLIAMNENEIKTKTKEIELSV